MSDEVVLMKTWILMIEKSNKVGRPYLILLMEEAESYRNFSQDVAQGCVHSPNIMTKNEYMV